ncbi:MAG: hypothetical protein JWM80_1546 [Cyanobacteria bacterium RYN_339]|nr:hypothetical protein [Cyanobacteria bacterium RYN_339]
MPTRRRLVTQLLAGLLAAGCQASPPAATLTTSAGQALPSAPVAVTAAATVVLSGIAQAPVGIDGIISTNGGGIISTNGGGVVPTGGGLYHVAALAERPLQSTTVYLADAAGVAYPGVASVQTDAAGRFSFPAVPRDLTVMVVARAFDKGRNKPVLMRTLVNPAAGGDAPVAVNAASTIVTVDVVQGRSSLGAFNNGAFQAAAAATSAGLADADVPDFSDDQALLARATALAAADAKLKADLDQTRQELQTLKDELKQLEETLRRPASPVPTPAPTAAPTAAPTTAPTAAPTAPPKPTPAPTLAPTPGPTGAPNQTTPQNCATRVEHRVELRSTWPGYPLLVVVLAPGGQEVARCTIPVAGGYGILAIPEGCAHRWELRGGDGRVLSSSDWIAPPGAPYTLYPPL